MPDDNNAANPREEVLWRKKPWAPRSLRTTESTFEWLEMTDDPVFAESRQRLEKLWRQAPASHRDEYTARLRSKRRTDFFSAYCELWYRDALTSGGISCWPPEKTARGSVPDWRIGTEEEPIAIAECHVRLPPDDELRNDDTQVRWFKSAFEKLRNKRIRLRLHGRTCGTAQPSAARLAERLDVLARQSPVEEDLGAVLSLGRHEYSDEQSGWGVDFTLLLRRSEPSGASVAQLFGGGDGEAYGCMGASALRKVLSRKARQHSGELPVVLCLGWNHFEHEPDFEEVCDVVSKMAGSLEKRQVCAMFWAGALYPWGAGAPAPRLLHWGSGQIAPLLARWGGPAVDVRGMGGA